MFPVNLDRQVYQEEVDLKATEDRKGQMDQEGKMVKQGQADPKVKREMMEVPVNQGNRAFLALKEWWYGMREMVCLW